MFGHLIYPNLNLNIWRRRFRIPIKVHGVKVLSHLLTNSNVANALCTGTYEIEEIESIQSVLEPHDRILDIGCGIGITSLFSARLEPTSKIESYDANPDVIKLALKHQQLNQISNCAFHNGVVTANSAELIDFFIPEQFWAGSTTEHEKAKRVSVPNFNLSDILSGFDPTVMFLDVEGGEYELLPIIEWQKCNIRTFVIELHMHPEACSTLQYVWPNIEQNYTSSVSSADLTEHFASIANAGPITVTLQRKARKSTE